MKRTFLLTSAIIMLMSCNKDFLNPKQVNLTYNEIFWSSEKDAQKALLGIYSLYRGLMIRGEMYERFDVTTGLFRRGWNGGSPNEFHQIVNIPANARAWGNLNSYADWGKYYKVIAMANLSILHIENMPESAFKTESKENILGQIYFLRALTYYHIATIWGNAPLVLGAIEGSGEVIDENNLLINEPRSTDIEILNAVLDDVNRAASLLQFGRPGSGDWGVMANKGSALALSGYANLWMAFLKKRDGQQPSEYYSKAVTDLEEVVSKGGYALLPYSSQNAVQTMYQGRTSEAVFEINVSVNQGETYRIDAGGIQFLTTKIPPLDGDVRKDRTSSINWIPANKKPFIYPDYPEDRRADLFFDAWASPYNDPFSDVSQTATDRNLVTWMTKYASFMPDPSREWNEYIAYFANSNIPVFRFTDVKLLLAEAYYYSNQSAKAFPIINEIRSRAGLTPYSGSDVLEGILQERISEVIGEGKLFTDFIRNQYLALMPHMTQERFDQQGYYWPVSNEVLLRNKMVQQTPYWNGKTSW